jgi:hypothetical protein
MCQFLNTAAGIQGAENQLPQIGPAGFDQFCTFVS